VTAAAGERGMTIVEVMVGVLLLVVGLGAAVAAFPASSHQTLTGQRNEQAAALAEREIEAIRARPYASVALTSMPTVSGNGLNPDEGDTGNPRNPDFYVTGTNYRIKQDYHDSSSAAATGTPAAGEPILVNAGGVPHISTVAVGGIDMTVYRYVTDHRELCPINFGNTVADAVSNLVAGLLGGLIGAVNATIGSNVNILCSGAGEKRVTVAVVPDRAGNRAGVTRPVYVTTTVADPALGLTGL
jgi:type II secretory pathway pseudopilin PulG